MTRRSGRPLVPAYLSTGGVARPSPDGLEPLSVLSSTGTAPPAGLSAALLALLDALAGGSLTVVEAAAMLELPVSVIFVLATDLPDQGLVRHRPPVPPADLPDPDLLKRVADGLRALKH